jgi:hypothetical protein
MVKDYQEPLLEAAETEALPGISKDDIRNIFLNAAHLLPINRTLLEQVSARIANWTESTMVGDIFLKMVGYLDFTKYYFLQKLSIDITKKICFLIGSILSNLQYIPKLL